MKLMGESIKNRIQLILACPVAKRSLWFGAVFFFVFLGLILPFQFVQAGFLDILAAIPVSLINLILQLILITSNLILGLAGLILGWVVGPYFTTLPYTHGGIVEIGWPIVRDFINMFFIIALVIIGLATALRIKEYQAQKALPILIIIAVLINFTPVICGLIVDASNIVMNFFLERLTGFQLIRNFFDTQASSLAQALRPSCFFNLGCAASALGKTTVMIVFGFVAGYIFFIYSLLFIMRYVMIWALVIVSPIAFFSKIFKGSEKYLFKNILGWDEWWKQFIEWSLLGVVAGFFLYLAEQLMMLAPGMISGLPPGQGGGGGVDNSIVDFVNNFLPWMVVLVFLFIGYKIAKSTSAMGAQGLIKAVDTGIKIAATTAVVAATGGAAAGLAAKGLGGMARGAQRMEAAAAKLPGGKVWTKPFTKPISWATRGMERAAAPTLLEYQAKTRRVPEADLKKIDGMSGAEAEAYVNAKTGMLPKGIAEKQKLQYMTRMAEKETLEHSGFAGETGEAASLANKTLEDENPYLQKEARSILKSTGGMSEKALIHSNLVGMPDKTKEDKEARKEKEDEIREEIKETRDIIEKRVGKDDYTIEVGLKLKYITKDDVKGNRTAALTEIQRRAALKPDEFERAQRNIAASATFTKELKPEDMKKMIDPDAFATRVGLTLGNPRNLQKIQDNFGIKKLKAVIERRGGLNDAMGSREKLEKFYKINPQMIKALFTSPAYKELNIEGTKYIPEGYDTFMKETAPKLDLEKKAEEAKSTKEAKEVEKARKKEKKEKRKKLGSWRSKI